MKAHRNELDAVVTVPKALTKAEKDALEDTYNEIDDQFALAWTLLSKDKIDLLGVTAEPYSFQHHKDELIEAFDIISNNKTIDNTKENLVSDLISMNSLKYSSA